jgi:hypothetical protein
MIVVTTDGNHGGGIVEVSEADEGMSGTLNEECLIDQGTEPDEDEGKKALEECLDDGREVREFRGRVSDGRW